MNVAIHLKRRCIVTLVLPQLAQAHIRRFVCGFQRSPLKSEKSNRKEQNSLPWFPLIIYYVLLAFLAVSE